VHQTAAGQAYDEDLAQCKECLLALCFVRGGGVSHVALGDFISFVTTQDFISPVDFGCLRSTEVEVITEHFLLAAYADPSCYSHICHFDSSTAPDTYNEA
jgi:hypothetical protein